MLIAVFNINTAYVILIFILLGIAVTLAGGKKTIEAAGADREEGGDGE